MHINSLKNMPLSCFLRAHGGNKKMRINRMGDLMLDVGIAVRVLNRWSLTEVEPDLSPGQAEEIRSMKAELYYWTVADIADFLKDEGYIVFSGELPFPCKRSTLAPVNG